MPGSKAHARRARQRLQLFGYSRVPDEPEGTFELTMALPPLSNYRRPKMTQENAPEKVVHPDHMDALMESLTNHDPAGLRKCLESLVVEAFDAAQSRKE